MQLVAYGAQDIYLTGNPQITFFKVVYRRHTNFSMETIEQTISGTSTLSTSSGTGTVTVSRNGDLVHKVYVTVSDVAVTKGSNIVSEVELEIGGQRIDRHYEEWNNIWNELSTPESKAIGLKSMQGDIGTAATGVNMTQVPLNFWFCRNPGLALPLIALQYHEVKLKFTWGSSTGSTATCKVFCDYIYLDTDERRRFAQVSHEYLIEQVQKQSLGNTKSEKLNFNHPVKELIWTNQATDYDTAKLVLNGHDRFSAQESEYFQLRQPFDYHTAVPKQNLPSAAQLTLLDRQTTLSLPATGSMGAAWAASYVLEDSDANDTAVANGKARAQIGANGVICLVIANSSWAMGTSDAAQPFDTQFPAGSEFIIVLAGVPYRLIKTSTTKTFTSSSFDQMGDGSGADDVFRDAQIADAENLIIVGTVTKLEDNTVPAAVAFDGANPGELSVFVSANANSSQARTSQMTSKINVYSFALKPEEHQPSGTCNFSRIDTAKLEFTGTQPNASQNVYAVNYNVLRIMSGMGGLAYSN